MDSNLPSQKQIALLIEQNVEDVEFLIPYHALQKAGAKVVVLGSRLNADYRGKKGKVSMKAEGTTSEAIATDFDAVVIPGGGAPDHMRANENTIRFVQEAFESGVLVATVCHGPQVLIDADLLKGIKATGFYAIRKDMMNAGAHYVDAPLASEKNLLTARRPGDLPIFTTALLQRLALSIPDTTLPDINTLDAGWWKLGEEWGGSTKADIIQAINTVIAAERYSVELFEHYANHIQDSEAAAVFTDLCTHQQQHLQRLEARLSDFGETPSIQVTASSALATLKVWIQSDRPKIDTMLRALRELQPIVVEVYSLCNQLTDPATVAILDTIESELAQDEQKIASLYRSWHRNNIEEASATPHIESPL